MRPNRLERAKLAVLDFIDKMGTDRIGLVAFSGSAFLQCPLTLDYNAFRQSLEILEPGVIPVPGDRYCRSHPNRRERVLIRKTILRSSSSSRMEKTWKKEALKSPARQPAEECGSSRWAFGSKEGEIIPYTDPTGRQDYVRDEDGQRRPDTPRRKHAPPNFRGLQRILQPTRPPWAKDWKRFTPWAWKRFPDRN